MKKCISILALVIYACLSTGCSGGKKGEVIHIIQATNGAILGDEISGHKLVLTKSHTTVIWFADRPIRKAGYIHLSDFLKEWKEKKGDFEKDPPNTVLVIGQNDPVVVEMLIEDWDETKAEFTLKNLTDTPIPVLSGFTTVFIDTAGTKASLSH